MRLTHIFCSIFFTVLCLSSLGQNKKEKEEIIQLYKKASKLYHKASSDSAFIILEKGIAKAKKFDNKLLIARGYKNFARANNYIKKGKAALKYTEKALAIYETENSVADKASIYMIMGAAYHNLGNIEEYLKNTEKAIQLAIESNDHKTHSSALNNLAVYYMVEGNNLAKSKTLYIKSLALNEQIEDDRGVAFTSGNLSYLCMKLGDYEGAIKYAKKTLTYGTKKDILKFRLVARANIGNGNMELGQLDSALKYFANNKNDAIKHLDTLNTVRALQNIAVVFEKKGKYLKAIDYYYDAIELSEQSLKAKKLTGYIYLNISNVYDKVYLYKKAKLNVDKALSIFTKENDSTNISLCYQILGNSYEKRRHYDSALVFHNKSLSIKQNLQGTQHYGSVLNSIGYVYFKKAENRLALKFYDSAITKAAQENDNEALAKALLNKGYLLSKNNENTEAIILLKQSLETLADDHLPEVKKDIYQTLSKIYYKEADYKASSMYAQLHRNILDSLFTSEKYMQLSALVNELDLSNIKKSNDLLVLNNSLLQKKKQYWIIVSVALLLLILVIVLVYRNIVKAKKERNKMLVQEATFLKNENKGLDEELAIKKKEIIALAMNVSRQQEVLNKVKENILEGDTDKDVLTETIKLINQEKEEVKDWELFNTRFLQMHPSFLSALRSKHHNLTPTEVRLCMFIRLEMTTDEIARVFDIAPSSVTVSRYRLKKKLNLEKEKSLEDYLYRF